MPTGHPFLAEGYLRILQSLRRRTLILGRSWHTVPETLCHLGSNTSDILEAHTEFKEVAMLW